MPVAKVQLERKQGLHVEGKNCQQISQTHEKDVRQSTAGAVATLMIELWGMI